MQCEFSFKGAFTLSVKEKLSLIITATQYEKNINFPMDLCVGDVAFRVRFRLVWTNPNYGKT